MAITAIFYIVLAIGALKLPPLPELGGNLARIIAQSLDRRLAAVTQQFIEPLLGLAL